MWAWLYLPKGRLKYERLDYWATDLAAILHGLALEQFSGSLEILSTQQHGLLIFHNGRMANCFYEGEEDLQLPREEILDYFIQKKHPKVQTVVNAAELDPRIIEAASALEARRPLYSELEVNFLDMEKMFETLKAKRFTGLLRFYHIRSHPRLGNILLKMNKINREQLQDAVRLQLSQKGSLRLGDALVQIGAIETKDIDNALNLQSHARKGSDIEVAIAVFHHGNFLGGYSHTHKRFERNRAEILPQLVGTEVLMDIIEGALPQMVDLEQALEKAGFPDGKKPAPAAEDRQAAQVPSAGAPAVDLSDESPLSTDDRILDGEPLPEVPKPLQNSRTTPPAGPPPAPARPDPVTPLLKPAAPQSLKRRPDRVDTHPAPESVLAAPERPPDKPADAPAMDAKTAEPESAPAPEMPAGEPQAVPLPPLEHLHVVAEKFMGPLGRRLLGREMQALGIESATVGSGQLLSLSERFVAASRLIIGQAQAQKMRQAVAERLGLTSAWKEY